MKKLFLNSVILLCFCLFVSCGAGRSASDREAIATQVREKVNEADFTFKATYALPTGYRSIYLSPYYDVKVKSDTLKVYLPYFGRAYSAPMDPREGGFNFETTKFDYNVKQGNKSGNWLVDIRTHDRGREIILNFDIWENGSARLSVTDTNRQPISFNGELLTELYDKSNKEPRLDEDVN